MTPRAIALTGASGMVGRHVAALLAERGFACLSTSRTPPRFLHQTQAWAPWDLAEWREPDALDVLFPGAEALIHAGAMVPRGGKGLMQPQAFDANVRGTLCLVRWAQARKLPVVHLSGAIVYAEAEGPRALTEDAATTARPSGGFYGLSKVFAEQIVSNAAGEGLRVAILRPSSIYGAGLAPDKMISSFLTKASRGMAITLAPPVDDRINLIHAHDVAAATLAALAHEAWGTFNVGSPTSTSLHDIAEACVEAVGRGHVEIAPGAPGHAPVNRYPLDSSAAERAFGFAARISLLEGLKRTHTQFDGVIVAGVPAQPDDRPSSLASSQGS